ncbi:hypothetical protein [Streptomyces spirodelae]|uniref:WXG100 family type VII secretion target n=1 Tax=Streptomyces spirodelae TaxID=2812904 RepID=A0ABS3WLK4_9ACTN|nr:hypothetical protein [Streptomyces spirodelae]MBO8183978.1 hypothetical protein [Streptomyces spirodelae]
MTDSAYEEAQRTVRRIQRLSDDCWHALDASVSAMDDEAWVGPVARRFHDAVRADQRELQTQLAKAVRDAQEKLAAMPGKP